MGVDAALTTLATEIAKLSGSFNKASASSGIFDIVGLTDGSPLTSLNVTLETKPSMASVGDTAITSFQAATNTLERLDLAVSEINIKRASFGAAMSRFDYAACNLSNIALNAKTLRSRVLDAHYAREATELARTQIIQQAAMAMLVQANMQASQVLELLEING
jgi:flagellin